MLKYIEIIKFLYFLMYFHLSYLRNEEMHTPKPKIYDNHTSLTSIHIIQHYIKYNSLFNIIKIIFIPNSIYFAIIIFPFRCKSNR